MYSKPKTGLYIKQRDKAARRGPSPRPLSTEVDSAYNSTFIESPIDVDIENFGDGQIRPTASSEPEWARRDSISPEHDQVETDPESSEIFTEPQPSTSKQTALFPERAKQYMVKNDSYKDLTGVKFITVPTPKKTGSKEAATATGSVKVRSASPSVLVRTRDVSPRSRGTPVGTVSSFTQVGSINSLHDIKNTSKPTPYSSSATFHGYPNHLIAKQSHIATIRLPTKQRRNYGKSNVVRTKPRAGTLKSVKGYHVRQNATVRVHNTGHAIRQLKQTMSTWDRADGHFHRKNYLADRKEYSISQFAIELDGADHESFTPGDVISGRVILEASTNIEIRFVELLIIGVAKIQFAKNDPNLVTHAEEALISKRSYMMGAPEGRWNSVITAGKYVSKFRFRLPNNLPSSVKYESKEHGFNFEVSYLVKARICDEIGSASARSTHSVNNYVKVLLTRRYPFTVRGVFNIHDIPKALQPVKHSEYVNLSCIPIFLSTANLALSLDRSVFLAGDDIRVKLTTAAKTSKKIRSLTCELLQRVQSNIKSRQTYTIVQMQENRPRGLHFTQNAKNFFLYEFIVPTHRHFVPSFLHGCNLLRVSYTVVMTVTFKSCSGRLFLECPVGIGPCADPMNPRDVRSVPIFNRPKRFPYFSKDQMNHNAKTQNGTVHSHENHTAKQPKSQGKQVLCCCIADEDS